jgi:hypothetical protein
MGDINFNDYEAVDPSKVGASAFLADMWMRLGSPTDPLSETGKQMVQMVIDVWAKEYTEEYLEWKSIRDEYKDNEIDVKEQVHQQTGRNLAAYPYPVLMILKRLFPDFDFIKRENCMKLVTEFPLFKFANRL